MTENTSRLSWALADPYKILRHLGEGGIATMSGSREGFSLWRYLPSRGFTRERRRRVRRSKEITTTASLQHPHIRSLFDSGEADSSLFYVMPFIDGETLRGEPDRETQFGIHEAVRITREIAGALDYAHRQGVIHRDILFGTQTSSLQVTERNSGSFNPPKRRGVGARGRG